MPEISLYLPGLVGAPSMAAKYVAYWPPTFSEKKRSMAYLTSLEVTSRFTGGENFTPLRILTVTVFLSAEISGSPSARSGTGLAESWGLNEYRVRWVG